ncbi:hypothetical protein DL766_004966 [Monosporascus sp. MC13-8B]|uniref:Uncharacterized protein n=1 Tax=Monosporascus cannonballus TaxID=155416 RepID=A0ABY0H316_9PEZI|nr:hypothetical protein DL762_006099 [Monosporascus cannonballus]RYO87991.1 hypothetical protein DL763_006143 [Monosporascus cannonballus]RYP30232.1 hypothetical protein DL766_004966 [Monosporascus sp. MC13-8B]
MSNSSLNNAPRRPRSRTQSISSDRPSTISHSLMSPPLSVSPEAAFIAASAASQIVTNDHDSHSEAWYDQVGLEPSGETALVSPGALQLANNFVDQLLFNIIAVAGSTALAALRPAVSEVLKPKLAKDAINQADEELREYLGGGEVEDLSHPATESSNDWDVELAWKRTRLRCMIYSSLGDMEEEDEDQYMEQEHLRGESGDILSEFVSPAVAIFLTSILEFMGEQVIVISAQAAFNRMRVKHEKELKEGSRSRGDVADRVVVEELDMERVALDRTLGRLWRAWKKRIRFPAEPNFSRPFSRSSTAASGLTHARHGSTSTDWVAPGAVMEDSSLEKDEAPTKSVDDIEIEKVAEIRPSAVPLPMSNNDIAEIEVPGLVWYSDEERSDDGDDEEIRRPPRPKSMIVHLPSSQIGPPAPNMSELRIPAKTPRRRANSLPAAVAPGHKSPPVNYGCPQVADTRQRHKPSDKDGRREGVHGKVESGGEDAAGLGSRLINGAAAVGSAAVDGLTAVATGAAPQTEADTGEIDDFVEEPEILTSSRISFGGRRSSAGSEPAVARPPSILIARSNSVRSARLIDVHSPRSPSVGSRTNSFDNADHPRPSSISREGSVSTPTPPIPEERELCAPPPSTVKRNGFVLSADDHLDVNTVSAPPPRARSPPKSVSSHSTGPTSATTKVTILNTPTPRSYSLPTSYLPQEIHDVPQKSSYRTPPLPTLPERSTGRQDHGRPDTMGATVAAQRGLPESPKVRRSVQADSPSSTTSNKLKAVRSSEDNGSHHSGDVVRNFEELIHSDQTLQYTLTPESMRSMDSNQPVNDHSPVTAHKLRKSEDAKFGESSRSSSFKRSLSVSKPTGLSSRPPADTYMYGKVADQSPRPPPVSMPTKTRSGRVARDARVPVESTQDFADFLRSTGPQGETGPPKRVRAGSVANARRASASVTSPRSTSMTGPPTSSATRARLQAREAAVASGNGSSELIDFIRRGPQDSTSDSPRIPRHVAPFRTTMDSDQMQMSGATGGRAVDAVLPDIRDSLASTNVTETSAPSSLNSQSALLSKANKPMVYSGNNFDDEDMVPKRKQRRVRDPYAVDLSDEDDDLIEDVIPNPKAKQEESLIDFLNNCEPPPEPKPRPQTLPKKKSAPNLIARLRSGHSNGGSFSSLMGKGSNAVESRPVHSRASTGAGKGYTPIAVNIPPSGVGNFGSDFVASPEASSPGTSAPARVPMKKFEPREAVSTATRTSDLASFLRDSEPPPSSITSPTVLTEEKPSHSFSRMFERRKKSVAY